MTDENLKKAKTYKFSGIMWLVSAGLWLIGALISGGDGMKLAMCGMSIALGGMFLSLSTKAVKEVEARDASPASTSAAKTPAEALEELKDLHDKGVLSAEEYEEKRKPYLDQL